MQLLCMCILSPIHYCYIQQTFALVNIVYLYIIVALNSRDLRTQKIVTSKF